MPALLTLACETINRRVDRLPFMQKGVEVTGELVGVSMECLNAEATRTLPCRTSPAMAKNMVEGFDRCLELRMGANSKESAPVVADVLIRAGIAEKTDVQDRCTHTLTRGLRLLPAWSWHIASETPTPYISPDPLPGSEPPAAWLAKCPVCKAGILQKVTGKELFGVPHTDYYVECTHCGAKYIPEKEKFRLVSIAKIRDPHWRQYLNTSRFPGDWAELVQESVIVKRLQVPTTRHPVPKAAGEINTGSFSKLKDGSIAVPVGEKTLFFRHVNVKFGRSIQVALFSRSTRTLAGIMSLPAYSDKKPDIERAYSQYLSGMAGSFLTELKQRDDPFYREFLNPYGDEEYCTFRIEEDEHAGQKGVFLVLLKGKVGHISTCHTSFGTLFNDELGRIIPDMCYRDGNETACRINSLVCSSRDSAGIYMHAMTDDAAIDKLCSDLKTRYMTVPPIAGQVPNQKT